MCQKFFQNIFFMMFEFKTWISFSLVKEYLNPQVRINKIVNQQCRLQTQSFRVNLKDIFSHISIDLNVISHQNNFGIFYQSCIAHRLRKVFKFVLFRLLENAFASQKLNPDISKSSSQILIITPQAEENYSFPQGQHFLKYVSPQQKKGERVTAIKQFIKYELQSHIILWFFTTLLENQFFRTGLNDCFLKIQFYKLHESMQLLKPLINVNAVLQI